MIPQGFMKKVQNIQLMEALLEPFVQDNFGRRRMIQNQNNPKTSEN